MWLTNVAGALFHSQRRRCTAPSSGSRTGPRPGRSWSRTSVPAARTRARNSPQGSATGCSSTLATAGTAKSSGGRTGGPPGRSSSRTSTPATGPRSRSTSRGSERGSFSLADDGRHGHELWRSNETMRLGPSWSRTSVPAIRASLTSEVRTPAFLIRRSSNSRVRFFSRRTTVATALSFGGRMGLRPGRGWSRTSVPVTTAPIQVGSPGSPARSSERTTAATALSLEVKRDRGRDEAGQDNVPVATARAPPRSGTSPGPSSSPQTTACTGSASGGRFRERAPAGPMSRQVTKPKDGASSAAIDPGTGSSRPAPTGAVPRRPRRRVPPTVTAPPILTAWHGARYPRRRPASSRSGSTPSGAARPFSSIASQDSS